MMTQTGQPRFISWQWLLPVFIVLLVAAMGGAYALGDQRQPTTFAESARFELGRLMLAAAAGGAVIIAYAILALTMERVGRVRKVAQALGEGDIYARTGMQGKDEIGALGQALDSYAEHVREKEDALQAALRRQRREVGHLTAVLEAIPDGIVVQDLDGHVTMMNDRARELLGTQGDWKQLTASVTDILGPELSPGLYTLGNPRQIAHGGRVLSAQAAAVMSLTNQRVGTVLVLHDITADVQRERARDALLSRLEQEVDVSLAETARRAALEASPMVSFAREMTRNAVALQKLIVEMRELTADFNRYQPKADHGPLLLDTLIWAVANEWRQVAQAVNLTLQVTIEKSGLYILGSERRLRWAIGNVVDNAIKYTPPGGTVSLEIRGEMDGMAHLRVRDNGTGIAADELPQVFTRFFRGTPTTEGGRVIRVPGTGQGLTTARQIIEAHGGNIRLKSTPGVGTAVYIALPQTAAEGLHLPTLPDMEGETVRVTVPTRIEGKK